MRAYKAPITLEEHRATVAKVSLGWVECIAKKYVPTNYGQMKYRCTNCNNRWLMFASNACKGAWCPKCRKAQEREARLAEYAKQLRQVHRNRIKVIDTSECISSQYGKATFQCSKGHQWSTSYKVVLKGHGCPSCQYANLSKNNRTPLSEVKSRLAEQWGGAIKYVRGYVSSDKPATFRCQKGHEWTTAVKHVISGSSGCPSCAMGNGSRSCANWLDGIMAETGIHIEHLGNGSERKISLHDGRQIRVDGYCEALNTVYEFHGSCWHGDPQWYEPDAHCHPFNPEVTAKELYEATLARDAAIRKSGYNLVFIWESEFLTNLH